MIHTSHNNFKLHRINIEDLDNESICVLRELIHNYGQPFIWTLSKKSTIFYDDNQLKDFLITDFGDNYILYLITFNMKCFGFIGITNVDKNFQRGELIIGIIQKFRKRHSFLIWWIFFLQNLQKIGIIELYAKIKIENNYAYSLAIKLGFKNTKSLSAFSNYNENSFFLYRTTSLIDIERKFYIHNNDYFHNINRQNIN